MIIKNVLYIQNLDKPSLSPDSFKGLQSSTVYMIRSVMSLSGKDVVKLDNGENLLQVPEVKKDDKKKKKKKKKQVQKRLEPVYANP